MAECELKTRIRWKIQVHCTTKALNITGKKKHWIDAKTTTKIRPMCGPKPTKLPHKQSE